MTQCMRVGSIFKGRALSQQVVMGSKVPFHGASGDENEGDSNGREVALVFFMCANAAWTLIAEGSA